MSLRIEYPHVERGEEEGTAFVADVCPVVFLGHCRRRSWRGLYALPSLCDLSESLCPTSEKRLSFAPQCRAQRRQRLRDLMDGRSGRLLEGESGLPHLLGSVGEAQRRGGPHSGRQIPDTLRGCLAEGDKIFGAVLNERDGVLLGLLQRARYRRRRGCHDLRDLPRRCCDMPAGGIVGILYGMAALGKGMHERIVQCCEGLRGESGGGHCCAGRRRGGRLAEAHEGPRFCRHPRGCTRRLAAFVATAWEDGGRMRGGRLRGRLTAFGRQSGRGLRDGGRRRGELQLHDERSRTLAALSARRLLGGRRRALRGGRCRGRGEGQREAEVLELELAASAEGNRPAIGTRRRVACWRREDEEEGAAAGGESAEGVDTAGVTKRSLAERTAGAGGAREREED